MTQTEPTTFELEDVDGDGMPDLLVINLKWFWAALGSAITSVVALVAVTL